MYQTPPVLSSLLCCPPPVTHPAAAFKCKQAGYDCAANLCGQLFCTVHAFVKNPEWHPMFDALHHRHVRAAGISPAALTAAGAAHPAYGTRTAMITEMSPCSPNNWTMTTCSPAARIT